MRSVRAWERLLLLAMGLDTKPLVNLIPFVAWAARKLGERGRYMWLNEDCQEIPGTFLGMS